MKNSKLQPNDKSLSKGKDNEYLPQIKIIFNCFSEPKTMLEASKITNIERANICRYIDMLRKSNNVQAIKKVYCPISKHKANLYTTNHMLFINNQLKLF